MIQLGIIAEDIPFSISEDMNFLKNEEKLKTCDVLRLSGANCPPLKNILYDFSDVVSNVLPDHPMVGAPIEIELKDGYVL